MPIAQSTMNESLNYHYHSGVGVGNYSSLPNQMIPKSKKTKDHSMATLDALESIAWQQIKENADFTDYYDMVEGRLVYKDFMSDEDFNSLQGIGELMKNVELPTYIKHYDILGMIVNQLIGELPNMTDVIRIVSDDDFAKNDFIREKEQRVKQYVQQSFTNHLNKMLAQKGINPVKDDFESEEEKQQYLQYLQEEKNKIVPPQEIEKQMSKSWKVRAVEWAEKKYEQDSIDFHMEDMEKEEMRDYLLTGRYFTHYRVGHDSYNPERWDPRLVFFSQNLDIENPQDGEYVGRMFPMTASQIVEKYGHRLSKNQIDDLATVYDKYTNIKGQRGSNTNPYQTPNRAAIVPDGDYFNREIYQEYQSAFNIPMGEEITINPDGTQTVTPTWISSYNDSVHHSANFGKELRKDIKVSGNTFRVTEAYIKGYNLYYAIRYDTEDGYTVEDLVKEDLLKEFIKENEIKIKKNMSLEEFMKSDETNIICPTYFPAVYSGIKIAGSSRSEDIYLPLEEMDFQIKGNSNLYDVKLPVAGIIGSSLAQRIRPYQLGHNISLNQITHLIEKELGSFFLVDIGLLPSDMKEGNMNEQLSELRDTIRDIGIFPVDMRKQNTQQAGNTANTFIQQTVTFTQEIQSRIELANYYKQQAYEQIGITEQRKGTPNEYQTNEGIKVGQEASYAQTSTIFTKFNNSRKKKVELHLAVAQYSVQNDKDISTFYTNTDNDVIYQTFSDDKFHLRKLGVRPTSDTKSKKQLESLKQIMVSDNTKEHDVVAFAEIAKSDSFTSLIEFGKRERQRQERLQNEQRQFEKEQLDKTLQSQAQEKQNDREWAEMSKQRDRENKLEVERLESIGRLTNADGNDEDIKALNEAANNALKKYDIDSKNEVDNRKLDIEEGKSAKDLAYKMAVLNKDLKKIKLDEQKNKDENFRSIINKN